MANEKRLIDANAFLEHWNKNYRVLYPSDMYKVAVANFPTVDAVEVVHGRWKKAHIAGYLKCNCCEDAFIYEEWLESGKWNYCPNCGAKMNGGKEA